MSRGHHIHSLFAKAAEEGQRIRGGCDSCKAHQTFDVDQTGTWELTVHRDLADRGDRTQRRGVSMNTTEIPEIVIMANTATTEVELRRDARRRDDVAFTAETHRSWPPSAPVNSDADTASEHIGVSRVLRAGANAFTSNHAATGKVAVDGAVCRTDGGGHGIPILDPLNGFWRLWRASPWH